MPRAARVAVNPHAQNFERFVRVFANGGCRCAANAQAVVPTGQHVLKCQHAVGRANLRRARPQPASITISAAVVDNAHE